MKKNYTEQVNYLKTNSCDVGYTVVTNGNYKDSFIGAYSDEVYRKVEIPADQKFAVLKYCSNYLSHGMELSVIYSDVNGKVLYQEFEEDDRWDNLVSQTIKGLLSGTVQENLTIENFPKFIDTLKGSIAGSEDEEEVDI